MKNRNVLVLMLLLALSVSFNIYYMTRRHESTPAGALPTESAEEWTCPMHPTIVQDHPGDCPICGMKLVKMKDGGESTKPASKSASRILFYRSPMNPNQTSHEPRKDEMGMDYVPVYEDEASGGDVDERAVVTIDPSRQQLIGLRTAVVTNGEVGGGWHTVGRVEVDPTRVSKINVKVAGYVDKIFVDFVGKPVMRGEPLFALYSPELLVAQQEYLLASKSGDSLTSGAARRKLELWDVPRAQIQRLQSSGEVVKSLTFTSPVTGVVTAKDVVEGTTLEPGATPFEVTDLSTVWMLADAYQSDLARVQIGMKASMSFESLPDRVVIGTVSFIAPMLDPQSRTAKVRLNVVNAEGALKPGMFGEVLLRGATHEALTIPADAIIPSGRGNYVFVAIGDGRFEPRAVSIGEKSDGTVEVLDGLSAGESVVVRANFLVDSESSLRAALSAMQGS